MIATTIATTTTTPTTISLVLAPLPGGRDHERFALYTVLREAMMRPKRALKAR